MGKQARRLVAIRVSQGGIDAVDRLAAEAGSTRSEVMRRILEVGCSDPAVRGRVIRYVRHGEAPRNA